MQAAPSLVPEGAALFEPKKSGWLRSKVERARPSRCQRAKGRFLVSASTGRAFELSCGAWECSHCGRKKREAARYLVAAGYERARARGESVRFMTLTTTAGMSVRDLYLAWNKLCVKLRRTGELAQYFAVLETTAGKNGSPPLLHLHILMTGRYIRQARLTTLWSWATGGRAFVTHIRAVRGTGDQSAAGYLVKQLAGYCAKGHRDNLAEFGARRTRPVRCSRDWYPGGFCAAERAVAQLLADERGDDATDLGPWLLVARRCDGSIAVIRGGTEDAKPTADDEEAQPSGGAPEEEQGGEAAQVPPALAT
jgi:hypothetical protein